MQEMLSTILLLSVLIHLKFDYDRQIYHEQTEETSEQAANFGLLAAPVVQLRAEALSVTLSRTGYGSSVADIVMTKWSAAQ
jgi:hypothetical protein